MWQKLDGDDILLIIIIGITVGLPVLGVVIMGIIDALKAC